MASAHETDAASQTSLGTQTTTMDSTSASQSQTSADDIIGVSSGKEMANKKLIIQQLEEKKILLAEKIKELEANEEEMQVFEFVYFNKNMG
jgi:glutamine phosphoribosylpyrophosphate amidotransferase